MAEQPKTPPPEPPAPDLRCDRCGQYDAQPIAHRTLCSDCVSICGSCCPELGQDDLWKD